MELLIAILFALGFNYSPEQVTTLQTTNNEEVKQATAIKDNHWYHYDADGGIVIEDGVNPQR